FSARRVDHPTGTARTTTVPVAAIRGNRMHTVRLLTFNTLYRGRARARLRGLGEALEDSAYDVACLQELMVAPNLALLRRTAPSYRAGVRASLYPLVRGGLATLSRLPPTGRDYSRFRP